MQVKDLARIVAEESGKPFKDVLLILNNTFENMKNKALDGEKIVIRGFGAFCLTQHKERKITNNFSHKVMVVPARKRLSFKPSRNLRKFEKTSVTEKM